MDTNSQQNKNKTQDTSTMSQDRNSTEDTWNLEKAREYMQSLLKDIPSGNKKGSVIMPAPKH